MNLRLLDGVLDGVPDAGLVAAAAPAPGRCCVRLEPDRGRERPGRLTAGRDEVSTSNSSLVLEGDRR